MDEGMGTTLFLICIFFVLFPGLLWIALKLLACVGAGVLVFIVALWVKQEVNGKT